MFVSRSFRKITRVATSNVATLYHLSLPSSMGNNFKKRCMASNSNDCVSEVVTNLVDKKELLKKHDEFLKTFPSVLEDLIDETGINEVPEIKERFAKLLEHFLPIGRYQSPIALLTAYKALEKPENLTPENLNRSYILAWCAFLFQHAYQIADDLLDNSRVRRGVPCWFTLEDVGLNCVNDSYLMGNTPYYLLKRHFSNYPYYPSLLELFIEETFKVAMGQCLDAKEYDFEMTSMERYNLIKRFKVEGNMYLLPFTLAMYLSDRFVPEQMQHLGPILRDMGMYTQVKNDYIDAFPLTNIDMAGGTDFSQARCTWMITTALQKADSAQRQILKEHYGKPAKKSVERVTAVYQELQLPASFGEFQVNSFKDISDRIKVLPEDYPLAALLRVLELAYDDKLN